MNDLEIVDKDILELESKLKELKKNRNNLELERLKEELTGKCILEPGLIFKITEVCYVYDNNKHVKLKGIVVSYDQELMISNNFYLDYDYLNNALVQELSEEKFNEKYKAVLNLLSKGYE